MARSNSVDQSVVRGKVSAGNATVECAICWRSGHIAKLCPYTAVGRLRQMERRDATGWFEPRLTMRSEAT